MKVKELFTISDFTQSVGGLSPFLNKEDCRIVSKRKTEHGIALTLKRESDGAEGISHLKVRKAFQAESSRLLNWAFASKTVMDLTLNQLSELETDLSIEHLAGRKELSD
jgi:hypothetical protein